MKKIITIAILCLAVLGGFAQSTNSFEYDNLNRLTKVYYANGAVTQYTYDALGNRLTKSVAGVSVSYTIAASVSPTNAGTVSGTGIYQGGSTCTLTASANAGYTFSNWTENGIVVSVVSTYSFPVTSDRSLVANFTDANGNGLLSGVFSVSENTQVGFSQGNLQYQASTNTWRFAENQWDYIGADNANASSTNSGWIDLFGWGTSGYNHGAVCYQPWSTSTTSADYYAYGNPSLNLTEGNGLADWGWNGISNGGQVVQSGWRTLSIDEWSYMLFTRPTPSGLRFAKANVEDVNGIILLPDDWSDSNYPLENVNDGEANYTDNTISGYEYGTDLESEGAVFLPVAGSRMGNSINFVEGVYWSATKCATHSAYLIYFNEEGMSNASGSSYYRYRGQSVRLVRTIEAATSYTIEATPNPVEGGTVAGAGTYEQGQTCTLTATFNEGYTFTAWKENGEVVSTDATYSFTVGSNRSLVANFAIIENIVFADPNVKAICVANWDTNGDGELSYDEAAAVTDIELVFSVNETINSFDELQYFTGLESLWGDNFVGCRNLASIVAPSSLTNIGSQVFADCKSLVMFEIPNSVTSIGMNAFSDCSSLISIEIPNSVTSIGSGAFYGCTSLTSIEIPSSIMSIGPNVVAGCSSLVELFVEQGNTVYDSRDNCNAIIETSSNTLIAGCKNTIIPITVTAIGDSAFDQCSGLSSIEIPNSVTSIGEWAFQSCYELTAVTIPNFVTSIGSWAFASCGNLSSIAIGNSVTYIGHYAFMSCWGISSIVVLAETPPVFEETTFSWMNTGVPVYVPCASVEAYQNAAWGGFSNFVGMCPYEITATANPVAGGTVTGGGTFDAGNVCTLTATADAGYTFIDWTENGEIVSTETVYGFIVTSNRDIEARFIQPLESMTDDFNDGVIDLTLWTNGGFNVYEEAGLMKIEQNETDDYVYLKSVPMLLADDNKIAIDRRFKLHRAWDYYYGETNVLLNGDENNYVRVQYFHDSYEGRYGTYMVSQLNGEHTEIYLCDALFDTWVTEHVEIDVSTGTLAYYRDGQFVTSVEVPHLVEQDFAYYNLMFRPFGWWTGHQHYMDWIAVNEDDKCFVSAFAEPSVGGVINGSGLYTQGQTCTLTASPADGYTFMNWTENGAVVSTSPTYIFDVTGHRTLTANFFNPDIIHFADPNVKAICVANWDTNGNGELSYAEAAAVTDIGNVFQYNYDIISFNELQYFTGLTYIGDEAFYNSDALTSVVIPISVTSIGNYAFEHCYSLNSIVIPNSVTSIGHRAFSQSNLTSIIIPNSVTSLGYDVFSYCGGLENIEVESGNPIYDSRDNCNAIIETATNTLITGCMNTIIPSSVTSIGDYAFLGCTGLTLINIPNSVTAIGAGAFTACHNLTSIEIPSSVTSIGYGMVLWCNGLENIVVESSNPVYDSRNNCNAIIETATNTLMAGCMNTIIPNSVTTIGEGAFQSCNNLTSIEIPNSVTSIGQMAFAYCYGLTSITVHSETPPTLEGYVFADVNQEIPILVPCGSVEAYQNAAWGGFSNFVGMCPYEITATANLVAGGTVTGGGTFDAGILCTLTATPNAGYTFGSWTENGETVSTDATYSFTVSGDRTLVANFAPEGNYWTPENTGNYSLTMALTGVIEIDGVEQFSDQLEVGAFCNGVCRGSQMASEFYLTNRYLVMLSIHGEIGDELTFKLYDHGLAQELNLTSPDAVTFTIDGYGTPIEPYALNFISSYEILATTDPEGAGTIAGTGSYAAGSSCTLVAEANDGYQFVNWTLDGVEVSTNATFDFTVTQSAAYVAHFHSVQTQTLAQGWNWWSTYIGQNGSDGLTMLENSLGSNGIRIQSKNNGYVDQFEYNGTSYWYGTLNALTNEQMYMVRTNTPCDATMTGQANALADHPITINNGWNWIGFPGSESVSVANAMSGFAPEANDQIKSKNNGYSTYVVYGSNALWYGTLNTLEPGQGYMYKSNSGETKTLVYQDGRGETRANVTTEGNMFQPNEADYAHNMTITAIVELGGDELRSDSYELAVFAGNECRGSAKLMYAELLDRYIAFLLVAGEAEENLRFVLADGRNARWSDDEMKFTIDGVVGSPIEPAIIHFGTLGVDENDGDNIIVYPNPSKNVFNIEGEGLRKVEIVNAYGQLIFTKEIACDYLQIDLGNRSAGVYMLRVVTEKGIKTQQIIKNN